MIACHATIEAALVQSTRFHEIVADAFMNWMSFKPETMSLNQDWCVGSVLKELLQEYHLPGCVQGSYPRTHDRDHHEGLRSTNQHAGKGAREVETQSQARIADRKVHS